MDTTTHADGSATLRLTRAELVEYFNLVDTRLADLGIRYADGTRIPARLLYPKYLQRYQLAIAIGRTDIPHPDQLDWPAH